MKYANPDIVNIPEFVTQNLKYSLFDWQREALENLICYEITLGSKKNPKHLMFNMATGTGKTLIMAAAMLYYYAQGYRHVLFFVHRNNIVSKTEDNFIESTHNKYLFSENIIIDNTNVQLKAVDTFSDSPQCMEVKFTSIQALYSNIHSERENQTTLEDLHSKNILMLADEAHHLNTETKERHLTELEYEKLGKKREDIERLGWEHLVIHLILNRNARQGENKNILLEFSATIPDKDSVQRKYASKTIFKYDLKKFMQSGHTKEINLISSTLEKKERVLHALLFQWFRHRVALEHNIANFKPVILFRSKSIQESRADYEQFLLWVQDLNTNDFNFLGIIREKIYESKEATLFEMGQSRTEQVIQYIRDKKLNTLEIVDWIQQSYKEHNVIITNSTQNKNKSEMTTQEQESLINSLEDRNNHIRALFTVDRLTEGWDVLNLYDIVRLYTGQNTGGNRKKTPEATVKEKQLIGRGVRYFPFDYKDTVRNKRRFDTDLDNPLRILEELYYYTHDEKSRYIAHLKEELRKDGYISDDKKRHTFFLKDSFKNTDFYKGAILWGNEQVDNPYRRKQNLSEIPKDICSEYRIQDFELSEQRLDSSMGMYVSDTPPSEYSIANASIHNETTLEKYEIKTVSTRRITILAQDIDRHIFLKAVNLRAQEEQSLLRFNALSEELGIESMEELQTRMLANYTIPIILPEKRMYREIMNDREIFRTMSNAEKLRVALHFIDTVFAELKKYIVPKVGGDFKPQKMSKSLGYPKSKVVEIHTENYDFEQELMQEHWYVLNAFKGTSEERNLIRFIQEWIREIQKQYEEYYLLRNEEVYKIYDFDMGRGFQPDFLLFLKTRDKKWIHGLRTSLYYQIFIEPKGNEFLDSNGEFEHSNQSWKQKFLGAISEKYGLDNIIHHNNSNYRLIGLPFFNTERGPKRVFTDEFQKYIFPLLDSP